jgi:uncharacterized repeat protein (TIGR03803 family)
MTQNASRRMQSFGATAAGAVVLGIAYLGSAQAQTFRLLHTFAGGADGIAPKGNLLLYAKLYGTTVDGGTPGYGTIFQLDLKTQKETVLYSFTGPYGNGANPIAGVVRDAQGTSMAHALWRHLQ